MFKILLAIVFLAGASMGGAGEPVRPIAPQSPPYDLSPFSIPYSVNWPTEPTIRLEHRVAPGNFDDLEAAVGIAGRRVFVPPGTYTGDLTSWASDVHVVASGGVVLIGSVNINAARRVRWTGGTIESSGGEAGIVLRQTSDVLLENLKLIAENGGIAMRLGGARYAIVNSTIELTAINGWGLHTLRNGNYDDIVLANVDISHNSTGAAFRINPEIRRMTVVDSIFEATHPARPSAMRFNGVVDGHIENVINIGSIHANYSEVAGQGNPIDITNVSMTNVHVYRDADYETPQLAFVGRAEGDNPAIDCVHHWANGTTIVLPGFDDGGGNHGVLWDEQTLDFSSMPGKASRADYGADH